MIGWFFVDLNIVKTHGASVFSYLLGVTKYFMNVVTNILVLLSTVLISSLQKICTFRNGIETIDWKVCGIAFWSVYLHTLSLVITRSWNEQKYIQCLAMFTWWGSGLLFLRRHEDGVDVGGWETLTDLTCLQHTTPAPTLFCRVSLHQTVPWWPFYIQGFCWLLEPVTYKKVCINWPFLSHHYIYEIFNTLPMLQSAKALNLYLYLFAEHKNPPVTCQPSSVWSISQTESQLSRYNMVTLTWQWRVIGCCPGIFKHLDVTAWLEIIHLDEKLEDDYCLLCMLKISLKFTPTMCTNKVLISTKITSKNTQC